LALRTGPDGVGAKSFPFLQTPFVEVSAKFSSDGKWVVYTSDESGQREVYVAPFPGPGGKRQISTAGGAFPRWRADSRELFYVNPSGNLMAAEVAATGGSIEVGSVRPLPIQIYLGGRSYMYDVSADGQRFLVAAQPVQKAAAPLTIVQNWPLLLKKQ
jgi:Tol biopolymer transport system component